MASLGPLKVLSTGEGGEVRGVKQPLLDWDTLVFSDVTDVLGLFTVSHRDTVVPQETYLSLYPLQYGWGSFNLTRA